MERFLTEARVAARLHHPNIVRILDAGQDEQGVFIVSEFVEGLPLSQQLQQRRYSPRHAAEVMSVIAAAVAHAHQSGIVHRDLKPQNILIDTHNRPMILDFGLAYDWFVDSQEGRGKLLGTPAYMAPEQASHGPSRIEPRSDVYAMGVILFQLLTGELPFVAMSRAFCINSVTWSLHKLVTSTRTYLQSLTRYVSTVLKSPPRVDSHPRRSCMKNLIALSTCNRSTRVLAVGDRV